jgi:diguanylate cyclase (GGDEF)-like protein
MLQTLSDRPYTATAALTIGAVAVSMLVTHFAMQFAGVGDFWLGLVLAGALPAVCAPLMILPLLKSNVRLRRMQVELERLARTDPLTGLPNRRAFFEHAQRMFARPIIGANLITAMMIDVDHFKALNDDHGHDTGDAVLSGIATAIRDTVAASSPTDWIVARMGGEEFAVLAEGLQPSAVGRLADRLCQACRRVVRDRDGAQLSATVSAGVAFRAEGMDVDALLKTADDAVYLAKRGGRDRWAFALGGVERALGEPPATFRQPLTIIPRPATR